MSQSDRRRKRREEELRQLKYGTASRGQQYRLYGYVRTLEHQLWLLERKIAIKAIRDAQEQHEQANVKAITRVRKLIDQANIGDAAFAERRRELEKDA